MALYHHISVFLISEEERASFLNAGIQFAKVTRGPRGESVHFDIGEDDPRWEKVVELIASLEGRDGMAKKLRVQDLSMTVPTIKEAVQRVKARVAAHVNSQPGPKWLDGFSGQSVGELLSLEGEYRIDSLVLAFEQAISQKTGRVGGQSLTEEERIVLAVEALEREVNNGGYGQFFSNSSREFAPIIVGALRRIRCTKIAMITQKAIKALGVSDLRSDAIEASIGTPNKARDAELNACDDSYYKSAEPVAERLFAFIQANNASIRF